MKIQVLHSFKALIAESAILMTVLYAFLDHFNIQARRRILAFAMLVLGILSVAAYFDFGRYAPIGFYTNRHDFFHYYMGSKYSKEVGYLHLYPCALVVDRENGAQFKRNSIRDQSDYTYTRVSEIVEDTDKYKAMFTHARWQEFDKDVLYFRGLMGNARWQKALRDKGYNATPVWNMVAHRLTNAVRTDNRLGMRALLMLDPMLIMAMLAFVWWAFGWRTMFFTVIFFGTNFMMNQTHIKGSLLRLDWITLMVIAVCFIKKARYAPAGALMGYAAMARIFPVIFVFGLGAKFFYQFAKEKSLNPQYVAFFIVFALTVGALFGISVAAGGAQSWSAYEKLIRMHNDDVVEVRAGFKYVFLMTYKKTTKSLREFKALKNKQFHDQWLAWWAIQGLVLLLSFFAVQRLEDYETIPYGFVLAYFLVAPTFYYYVMLVIALFLFAPKLSEAPRAAGLALLFAFSVVGYTLYQFLKLGYTLFFWNSVMYLAFSLFIMVVALRTRTENRRDP